MCLEQRTDITLLFIELDDEADDDSPLVRGRQSFVVEGQLFNPGMIQVL